MCAYVYPHTLNIGVLGIYKGWNRYRVEMQVWRTPHSQSDRRHEKSQRLWGNLWTHCMQKTQTVYSAYSLFFKERKLQKKNSRDLAKFQSLLERRRLVGHEKSIEISGSLFSKFMVCLPCNVAGEFPISTCEILSSACSPSCTKSLVTKRKQAFSQLGQSLSSLVSCWSSSLKAAPPEHRWQRRAWHSCWGKAVSVWAVLSLLVFVHTVSFPYRDVIGIMIRELKRSCPRADLLVHLAHCKLFVLLSLLNTVYVVLPK